jgi:hypothetical protein
VQPGWCSPCRLSRHALRGQMHSRAGLHCQESPAAAAAAAHRRPAGRRGARRLGHGQLELSGGRQEAAAAGRGPCCSCGCAAVLAVAHLRAPPCRFRGRAPGGLAPGRLGLGLGLGLGTWLPAPGLLLVVGPLRRCVPRSSSGSGSSSGSPPCPAQSTSAAPPRSCASCCRCLPCWPQRRPPARPSAKAWRLQHRRFTPDVRAKHLTQA